LAAAAVLNAGAGTLTFASTVNAGPNNLTLASDAAIALNGGANSVSGSGTGSLTLQTATAGTSVGVAGDTGTLQITPATLQAIKNPFTQVVIGRTDGTATLSTKAATFTNPVLLQEGGSGGQIVLDGSLTGQGTASVSLTAGQVTVNAANVAVTTAAQ